MIGGNITATLQVRTTTTNEIGESVKAWHDVLNFVGYLDYQSGDARFGTFNAKLQESTHVFVCDYMPIPATFSVNGEIVKVNAESLRMVANSQAYDVILIDNPMELNRQLEIYLKYTGGQ
jgi:hypothetical protein